MEAVGTSQTLVFRALRANGLEPHSAKQFTVDNDPHVDEKAHGVAGLYLKPPERASAISADEKTSIQALDRTQPELPIERGRRGAMTHGCKRNEPNDGAVRGD